MMDDVLYKVSLEDQGDSWKGMTLALKALNLIVLRAGFGFGQTR